MALAAGALGGCARLAGLTEDFYEVADASSGGAAGSAGVGGSAGVTGTAGSGGVAGTGGVAGSAGNRSIRASPRSASAL
jgi:hypothetical protein